MLSENKVYDCVMDKGVQCRKPRIEHTKFEFIEYQPAMQVLNEQL